MDSRPNIFTDVSDFQKISAGYQILFLKHKVYEHKEALISPKLSISEYLSKPVLYFARQLCNIQNLNNHNFLLSVNCKLS